jgi:hypothetical protein
MNKSIKFDDAQYNTEEMSFVKISLPPVANITKQSVKSSKFMTDSKKFNSLSDSHSRMFKKSNCCAQALLLNVKGGLSHMLENTIGLECLECYPSTQAIELLQKAVGPKAC